MKEVNSRKSESLHPEEIRLERKVKIKKYLGIGSIAAAAVFLFFPELAIFDFLPDFVGYIILLCGISQLRDLNDYFGSAYDRFYKIAWITGAKFLSFFIVLGLVTPRERPDTMLLIAFIFAVFECVFVTSAWKELFEGFSYLTARYGSTSFESIERKPRLVLIPNRKKGHRFGMRIPQKPLNRIESMKKLTLFFIVFKSALNVLPEFSALTADTELESSFRLYDYIGTMRVLAMAAVAVAGILWLRKMFSFTSAVRADGGFIAHFRERYRTDVLVKDHLFVHRHLQTALFLISLAVLLRFDLRFDQMNILPDTLMMAMLLIACVVLGNHIGNRRSFVYTACGYGVFSFLVSLYDYRFHYLHSVTSIQTREEAYRMYTVLCGLKIAEQALFVLTIALFLRLLRNVIHSYTGFSVSDAETRDPNGKIRTLHKRLTGKLKPIFGLAVLSAVVRALTVLLLLEGRPGLEMDWLPLADFLATLLFAVFSIRTVREIYSQVEYRFMLL